MLKKFIIIIMVILFSALVPTKLVRAEDCKTRLQLLEPDKPQDIKERPLPLPKEAFSIQDIINKGKKLTFNNLLNDPNYERPIYQKHWHSSIGRWSYLPNRIRYASHRLFADYDIGLSNWYDFEHNLGLEIPMKQTTPLNLYLVTFQTEVKEIYTMGQQIIIVGIPKRQGVEVNTISLDQIAKQKAGAPLLIQLVIPDGYEIDYTVEFYVDPLYWQNVKEENKN